MKYWNRIYWSFIKLIKSNQIVVQSVNQNKTFERNVPILNGLSFFSVTVYLLENKECCQYLRSEQCGSLTSLPVNHVLPGKPNFKNMFASAVTLSCQSSHSWPRCAQRTQSCLPNKGSNWVQPVKGTFWPHKGIHVFATCSSGGGVRKCFKLP